jgi:hypothetical protein
MKKQILVGLTLSLALFGAAQSVRADDLNDLLTEAQTLGGAAMGTGSYAGSAGLGLATGIKAGRIIEHKTGAGSKAGQWLYDHSDPNAARKAADKFYDAEQDWNNGNYGDSLKHGAHGVRKMYDGLRIKPIFDKFINPLVVR